MEDKGVSGGTCGDSHTPPPSHHHNSQAQEQSKTGKPEDRQTRGLPRNQDSSGQALVSRSLLGITVLT